ncbi:MAG: tRNA 4-thiouridine(8) synthase ThiI [Actinobacteria bacterium]|nr:tRNA 4-thiouridine(8) synthase ThiI [Actinomycetota bacterium]
MPDKALSGGTMDALIAHYHEIGLKGRNRMFFEDALVRNLRRALEGTGYKRVQRNYGRVLIELNPDADTEEVIARASRVFGIAYVGAGVQVSAEIDEIKEASLALLQAEPFTSFAIRARRQNSRLEMKSNEINIEVGSHVQAAIEAPVDLSNPDATVWIELFDDGGVVFRRRVRGPGGLPVGTSGRMLALLSGGIDSPVAAWRMARRGAIVEFVHFHGQPFTDPSSVRQAQELAEVLARYQLKAKLHLIPLADAQREIVTHAASSMRVVLYRRTMMRIASALADELGCKALITGDSLGQVASQTIENIKTVDDAIPGVEVLRPLIGNDKQEIIDLAIEIGTYDISIRAYQDCCVLFEPRSPATRSKVEQAELGESELDIDALVGKALAARETIQINFP